MKNFFSKKKGAEQLTAQQLNEATSKALFELGLLEQQVEDLIKVKRQKLHEANELRGRYYAQLKREGMKMPSQPAPEATELETSGEEGKEGDGGADEGTPEGPEAA